MTVTILKCITLGLLLSSIIVVLFKYAHCKGEIKGYADACDDIRNVLEDTYPWLSHEVRDGMEEGWRRDEWAG